VEDAEDEQHVELLSAAGEGCGEDKVQTRSRRWRHAALRWAPGCWVELVKPDVPDEDHDLLLAYWLLLRDGGVFKVEDETGVTATQYLTEEDVPTWARDFLEKFPWTRASLEAYLEAQWRDRDEASTPARGSGQSSPAKPVEKKRRRGTRQKTRTTAPVKATKWGRCLKPGCSYALRPQLGERGPFLTCSKRSGCKGKAEVKAEQWDQLPASWKKVWPKAWAAVSPWKRPKRPVHRLRSARPRSGKRSGIRKPGSGQVRRANSRKHTSVLSRRRRPPTHRCGPRRRTVRAKKTQPKATGKGKGVSKPVVAKKAKRAQAPSVGGLRRKQRARGRRGEVHRCALCGNTGHREETCPTPAGKRVRELKAWDPAGWSALTFGAVCLARHPLH